MAAADPSVMLANLLARKQEITNELATLVGGSGAAGSLPNVNGPGANLQHQEYRLSLYDEMDRIDQQIARLPGPFEIQVQGTT